MELEDQVDMGDWLSIGSSDQIQVVVPVFSFPLPTAATAPTEPHHSRTLDGNVERVQLVVATEAVMTPMVLRSVRQQSVYAD